MKKYKLVFLLLFINFFSALAQVPQKFQYQLIVYNGTALQVNKTISIKVNITDQTGNTIHYREKHSNLVTNAQGLVTLLIGSGAVEQGVFSTIPWRSGSIHVKFQIDYNGETAPVSFVNYGAPYPLLSVPYALQSNSSSNIVSVVDYGAIPNDDATDDNAIQKTIDENPGKTIYFPAGIYYINKTIRVSNTVKLVGEGKESTIFIPYDYKIDGVRFNGEVVFDIKADGVSFYDFWIWGSVVYYDISTEIPNLKNAIYSLGHNDIFIKNVTIQNFYDSALIIEGGYNWTIDNINIRVNPIDNVPVKTGIKLIGAVNDLKINNSHILVEDTGISIKPSSTTIKAYNIKIDNTLFAGAKKGISSEGMTNLQVTNSLIDLTINYGVYLKDTEGALFTNNWIATATLSWDASGTLTPSSIIPDAKNIYLEGCKKISFSGNHILNGSGSNSITLIKTTNSSFTNNIIELWTPKNLNQNPPTDTPSKRHLLLSNSNYCMFKNNIFRWFDTGIIFPSIDNNGTIIGGANGTNNIVNPTSSSNFNVISSNILKK